jgi:hypothetical protein
MIVRNVERQGYPFLEAARSALAVCDELLISDGFSEDRTWEGLVALEEVFEDRVKLFRDNWPGPENTRDVVGKMTNRVRRRCQGDWCLSVQANEVLHEAGAASLAALPVRHPGIEIFTLPYLIMMGPSLVWTHNWRRRLFKNIPDIVALGDAYEVGEVLPRVAPTMYVSLPEPIYRYRALFPVNYVTKLQAKNPSSRLLEKELRLAAPTLLEAAGDSDPVDSFWRRTRFNLENGMWEGEAAGADLPPRCVGTTDESPAVMRHLVGAWRYRLEDSLEALTSWTSSRSTS